MDLLNATPRRRFLDALTKLLKEITSCSFSHHLRDGKLVFAAQALDVFSITGTTNGLGLRASRLT
jgi:hypothetical protein